MLGVCRRVVRGSLVPCLSRCWRGPTWAPFYKPVVPGAPAHTGVGKEASHQDMWRFFMVHCPKWEWRLEAQRPWPPWPQCTRMKSGRIHKLLTTANSNHPAPILLIVRWATTVIYVLGGTASCCSSLSHIVCIQPGVYVCLWYDASAGLTNPHLRASVDLLQSTAESSLSLSVIQRQPKLRYGNVISAFLLWLLKRLWAS